MRYVFQVKRNDLQLWLALIKKVKAPNAFILGQVESFLEKKLKLFDGDTFKITVETGKDATPQPTEQPEKFTVTSR